jgi:hypothetical protein
MPPDLITANDVSQLQDALAIADLFGDETDPTILRQLIMRFEHVKVQIYSEKGPHKRPHFHIEFKRQFRASYAIDTLERIIGYMPRRYEDRVLDWARSVQPQLTESWQRIAAGGEPLKFELEAHTAS